VDVLSWSAWTGNAIALGGIAYTWWTGRGAKQAAAAANARADKSLTAAQEAAAAQQRMADVLEKMYEAQEHHATATLRGVPTAATASVDRAAPWALERTGDGTYRLTNAGADPVYDVRITASDAVRLDPAQLPQGVDWPAGEAKTFHAVVSWRAGTPQLTVSWHDAGGGDAHRWERVIPL